MDNSTTKNQTTPNVGDTVYNCTISLHSRIFNIIISIFITVTVSFGNTLILITLRKFPSQFKGTLYNLIGNLAVADLCLAVGYALHLLEFTSTRLEANIYLCVVKTCCVSLSVISSSKIIMFMSFDRFFAVVFPMKHLLKSSNKTRRRILIGFVWVSSVATVCAVIITSSVGGSKKSNESQCRFGDFIPSAISIFASAIIPVQFLINIFLCAFIFWRIKTNDMSGRRYKSSFNKCRILVKIYVIFILCWTPYIVTTFLLETATSADRKEEYFCAREKAILIGCLNSGMNWIIYGLYNQKFRGSFKDVLLCRKCSTNEDQIQFSSVAKSNRTKSDGNKASADDIEM